MTGSGLKNKIRLLKKAIELSLIYDVTGLLGLGKLPTCAIFNFYY